MSLSALTMPTFRWKTVGRSLSPFLAPRGEGPV